MDEDDYPNFGGAFPTSTTVPATKDGQASWNPALRPDADPLATASSSSRDIDGDDDFFDRYPGATPEKLRKPPPDIADPDAPAQEKVDREKERVTNLDGPVLHSDSQDDLGQSRESDTQAPAAHYEHQSEVTALDEALDESVRAPLIEDEQPEPVLEEAFEAADVVESKDIAAMPARSFTTNFTDMPVTAPVVKDTVPRSDEWPAVGDDKTFAELLSTDSRHGADGALLEQPVETAEVSLTPEHDLAAAWAAALDDDDILIESDETDPVSFFGDDDDDGFLLEDDTAALPPASNINPEPQRNVSAYTPATVPTSNFSHTGSSSLQNHSRSGGTPDTGLYGLHTSQPPAPQNVTRPGFTTTQSFVDKPRSDYQSPYDLPIDVVKPRRRPQASVQSSQNSLHIPPPRTSSFGSLGSPVVEQPLAAGAYANLTPPSSSSGQLQASAQASNTATRPSQDFFADLPVTSKARLRPDGGYNRQASFQASTYQAPGRSGGPVAPPQLRSTQSHSVLGHSAQQQSNIAASFRQPERAPLFPDTPGPQTVVNGASASPPSSTSSTVQSRYSPVLPPTSQVSSTTSRYSPAPADPVSRKPDGRYSSSPPAVAQYAPSRQAQPFLPRTSSPLATHGRPAAMQASMNDHDRHQFSPERRGIGQANQSSPEQRKASLDVNTSYSSSPPSLNAPRSLQSYNPGLSNNHIQAVLSHSTNPTKQGDSQTRLAHRRLFSKDLPFSAPVDETSQDPFQRWKGHPIFHWSDAGLVINSLPRHTPYYASGAQGPSIKCTPGEIKIVEANQILALDDVDAKFPGPLSARSKGKKKELLVWLAEKLASIQHHAESLRTNFELAEEDRVAYDEKLVLWKVMQVYLTNDGVLDGSPKLEEEVRQILLPDLAQKGQVVELQSPTSAHGTSAGDVVDTAIIGQIRQALFEGRREHAIRLAEEKHLWGHAMLIASTMDPEIFRQIISSFVRSQVKSPGGSEFRSLASLYQVFAGSPDDCVDELVPPSARAGFQMISTTDGRGTGEALGGLDKWRETVSLVHSNPTPHNTASLLAIGRLLRSYGRINAAHTCFLFARGMTKHSGSDDQDADLVLFGADTAKGDVDLDAMVLTEIFEFASSWSGQSGQSQYIPHLQAYKLLHGQTLAAYGLKAQAQQYCDHIDSAIKSTTRPSGYYHQAFAQELIKFNEFLSQSPQGGTGAGGKFFSRPAIGKVSSGVGSWFTKFVSGDEGDTDSNASGQAANDGETFGTFGGVSANSMPISRTTSTTELHNPMLAPNGYSPQMPPPSSLPKRYTPQSHTGGNRYAPSSYVASRTSLESDRSFSFQAPSGMPSAETTRATSARYAPTSAGNSPALLAVQGTTISRRTSNQSLVSTGSYEPRPLLAEHDGFGYPQDDEAASLTEQAASEGVMNRFMENAAKHDMHDANSHAAENHAGNHDVNIYATENNQGYTPPTMTYEPPSAGPQYADDEDVGTSTATLKKRSFMDDDDDDLAARAAALKISQPRTSRDPDPAVLAAAQAEAAKDGQSHDKRASGWFGGWFGKKEGGAAAGPGPIKAKLGEESSFYFDKDLNKWVNKKAGADSATPAAATPPPPRAPMSAASTPSNTAPPSRAASSSLPPLNGPPSRRGTPMNAASQPRSTSSGTGAPDAVPGNMGPPPRPSSSMSTASSLDDLLGGPAGRKSGTGKAKKKGGRYVDVMANAN